MSIGLGTAIGYLKLDASGFAHGLDDAMSSLNDLDRKVQTSAQGLQTIGGTISKAGGVLTAGFTAPVAGFGVASVKSGVEFDASMSKVESVSKATAEDLEIIRDRAIEMGEKTRYSATQVSDAMYYMGLAGWDAQEIYKGIPGVLALGAASGEDLSRVSDIVTDSLTAFGKGAEDTTEFVNVLSEATRSSNTTVDLLGESFKYVGPVAGAFGYSIQDTAIMLGIFANNGIKGSQAGTGLRQALNSLINPTDKAAAVMDKYGVSLFNSDGSTKTLMTVMEELRGTFGNLAVDIYNADGEVMSGEEIMEKYGHSLPTTQMEKLLDLVKMFGVRALPGMLSVVNASEEDFDTLSEAVYGAQDTYEGLGTAFGMQETMLNNLQGDWYLFTSALGTTKILLSDMANGALRDFVQKLTDLVNKFNELDPEQREQIVKWALIVASIGPVLVVVGKLISGVGSLITTFTTLKSAFSVVGAGIKVCSGNIGAFMSLVGENGLMTTISGLTGISTTAMASVAALAAVVVVLVAAFVNLWQNNEEFREKIIGIWDDVRGKFEEAGQKITQILNDLGFNFESFKDVVDAGLRVLRKAWDGFCELLAPVFISVFRVIGNTVGSWIDGFVAIFEIITGIIKGFKDGDWSLLWEGLGDAVDTVIGYITGLFDSFMEMIWGVIQTVAGWFGADWDMTWDDAKKAVSDFIDSVIQWFKDLPGNIVQFFKDVGEAISDFFSDTWEFISAIPGNIADFFSDIFESVSDWVTDMIDKAVELGTDFLGAIVEFFSELPGNIWDFITEAFDNVSQWVVDMVDKAGEMGSDFIDAVVEFFSDLPYQIGYYIGFALGSVIKWAGDMVDKAGEMASDFVDGVVWFFTDLPVKIWEFITESFDNVVQWADDMISEAERMGSDFIYNVIEFFKELPGKVWGFLTDTFDNVVQWADDMISKAEEAATNFVINVIDTLKELPGKIWDKLSDAFSKVKQWAEDIGKKAKDAATDFIDNVINTLKDLPGKIWEKLSDAVKKAGEWVTDMGKKGKDAIDELIKNVKDAAKDIPKKVKEIGENIVDGVWEGIKSAKDGFTKSVKGFFGGIVDGVKGALGIKSPSRVFRDQIGRWLPPGISKGFADAMPAAVKDIEDSLNNGIDNIEADNIDNIEVDNVDVEYVGIESSLNDFIDTYKQVFENLVVWFETMEEKMAISIEKLTDYFRYLMYVRQIIGNDDKFKTLIFGESDNKTKKTASGDMNDTSINGGGDVYNFYSPKPIDALQAARMLKNTKRDLAEGF